MKWTYKLNEEEFKILVESLKNLFNSINAEVILDNTPTKLYESMNSLGQGDSWETYNYNIKINSKLGNYEVLEGFVDNIDVKIQIKNLVKTIGMEYCIRYDWDRKTSLAQEIDKIE